MPSQIGKELVLFLRLHALSTMFENDAIVSVILAFYPKNVIKLIEVIYHFNYEQKSILDNVISLNLQLHAKNVICTRI